MEPVATTGGGKLIACRFRAACGHARNNTRRAAAAPAAEATGIQRGIRASVLDAATASSQ
jgi:hypothetical protein